MNDSLDRCERCTTGFVLSLARNSCIDTVNKPPDTQYCEGLHNIKVPVVANQSYQCMSCPIDFCEECLDGN